MPICVGSCEANEDDDCRVLLCKTELDECETYEWALRVEEEEDDGSISAKLLSVYDVDSHQDNFRARLCETAV